MALEKYPLPSMKLKDVIKQAHSKVAKSEMGASEKASLNTLLKSAAFKIVKREHAESVKASKLRKEKIEKKEFSDPEMKQLMKEAMLDIEKKDIELQKMKSRIVGLEKDSKELKNLQHKAHEDRVQEIVKREHSLGIISEEQKADKTEIYKKLHSEDLAKIEETLKGKKPVAASKMSEVSSADASETEGLEARRQLFAKAGIDLDPSEIDGEITIQD